MTDGAVKVCKWMTMAEAARRAAHGFWETLYAWPSSRGRGLTPERAIQDDIHRLQFHTDESMAGTRALIAEAAADILERLEIALETAPLLRAPLSDQEITEAGLQEIEQRAACPPVRLIAEIRRLRNEIELSERRRAELCEQRDILAVAIETYTQEAGSWGGIAPLVQAIAVEQGFGETRGAAYLAELQERRQDPARQQPYLDDVLRIRALVERSPR